jgi:hypothetical protein
MKVQILTFTLLATLAATAQRGWQLGLEVNPGYYTMLNEVDKRADPEKIAYDNPELLSAPRAWATGLKAFYGFTESIGLQTGLRYSWSRQDYKYGFGDKGIATQFGTISAEINQQQLPVMFSWNGESKSGTRFYASVGMAASWIFTFYTNNSFSWNAPDLSIHSTIINDRYVRYFNYQVIQNGQISETSSTENSKESENNSFYKPFNLFFTAEAGFRIPLNDGWHFNVAINYYQSLLNPDNTSSVRWLPLQYTMNETTSVEGKTAQDRPKSTMMTIGVSLGLLYEFDW